MDRSTSRLVSQFLSYGLPILYLLTSIGFYLHTYDSAQVKITLVQMLGTTLIGFWYVSLACEGLTSLKGYLPIVLPLLASLLSGVISYTHTAYPGPSIDEILRRVFYIHFALIALKEINTLQRVKRVVSYILVAAAIASAYGLIQYLDFVFFFGQPKGLDPFVWRLAFYSRAFSTFGNPNFYGNFLVIVMPITLALLFKRHNAKPLSVILFALSSVVLSVALFKATKLLGLVHVQTDGTAIFIVGFSLFSLFSLFRFGGLGLLFFLISFGVISTESKGAWVGYAGAFTCFVGLVLAFFSRASSKSLRRTVVGATAAFILVCGLLVAKYSQERMDSIRFRVFTWGSTCEMFLMHPIIGNGVGCFKVIYPAFRRPQIFHIEGKHNTETDHAENEYWEVMMDEGLIGFGIFLWMICTFSMMGVRTLRRFTEGLVSRDMATGKKRVMEDSRAYYLLGILSGFWGMLIHNFMDVSLRFVSSGIFLWLLAGLIGAMAYHDPLPVDDAQRNAALPVDRNAATGVAETPAVFLNIFRLITFAAFAAFMCVILKQFDTAQAPAPQDPGELLLWLISWGVFLATLAGVAYAAYRICSSLRKAWAFPILWVMLYPLSIFWGYFMADYYHNRGIYFSKQREWPQAISSYEKVTQLNPNYIMAYYFLGNVYTDRWASDDFNNALAMYKKVWAIAPNYVQSQHQAGLVYLKKAADIKGIADQQRAKGMLAEAGKNYAQAQSLWEESLVHFHKYYLIDPVFGPNYARMGWVHIQLAELARQQGDFKKADMHFALAEDSYLESLEARVCGIPENDLMHENWKVTHRHPDAEMFENLGNVRFMRNNIAGAVEAFENAVAQDPKNVRILKNLAFAYSRLGKQAEIKKTWLRIRELAPADPDVARVFSGHG